MAIPEADTKFTSLTGPGAFEGGMFGAAINWKAVGIPEWAK
ncbi:hypothetical protein OAV21_03000 [bacterium]|jgi:hypothetical protein|nr:hypothetical protein [bacterium]